MANESSVRVGSGVSVLRGGLVPGYPVTLPGMRGSNSVVINYEDINSMLGLQSSGLQVAGNAIQVSGPDTRLAGRRQLQVQNLGTDPVYIGGDSSVSSTEGVRVPSGDSITLNLLDIADVWIVSGGSSDVRVLELK